MQQLLVGMLTSEVVMANKSRGKAVGDVYPLFDFRSTRVVVLD
jgi:hypothetical protein